MGGTLAMMPPLLARSLAFFWRLLGRALVDRGSTILAGGVPTWAGWMWSWPGDLGIEDVGSGTVPGGMPAGSEELE